MPPTFMPNAPVMTVMRGPVQPLARLPQSLALFRGMRLGQARRDGSQDGSVGVEMAAQPRQQPAHPAEHGAALLITSGQDLLLGIVD
jgi:hypothetical protein